MYRFPGLAPVVLAALVAGAAQQQLADAVLYGRTESVRTLIAEGADVNGRDDTGMTPLMVAASQGQTAIARMLITAGARVDAKEEDGTRARGDQHPRDRGL